MVLFPLFPGLGHSAIAQSRPSGEEPLHGLEANVALVNTLGKPPEAEDPAIGREWSPRGGRRLRGVQERRRRQGHHGGESDAAGRSTSPPSRGADRERFRTRRTSRSPKGRRWSGRRSSRRPTTASQASPSSASYSPTRRRRGKRGPRRVRERGRGGGLKAKLFSTSSDDDAVEIYSLLGTSDDDCSSADSFFAGAFGVGTGRPSDMSAEPPTNVGAPTTSKSLGNLGGPFAQPGSSYRTYRAKHARLLRAQSAERAATRARKLRRQELIDRHLLPRSRSANSARRRRGRRHGSSGMASPLLRWEGFGLLQSSVTGKVRSNVKTAKCRVDFASGT